MSLCIIISSCFKTEILQFETANTDPATFANGQQLPTAPRSYLNFCGAPKACKFLFKYDMFLLTAIYAKFSVTSSSIFVLNIA